MWMYGGKAIAVNKTEAVIEASGRIWGLNVVVYAGHGHCDEHAFGL